jgi:hypothetical protein
MVLLVEKLLSVLVSMMLAGFIFVIGFALFAFVQQLWV